MNFVFHSFHIEFIPILDNAAICLASASSILTTSVPCPWLLQCLVVRTLVLSRLLETPFLLSEQDTNAWSEKSTRSHLPCHPWRSHVHVKHVQVCLENASAHETSHVHVWEETLNVGCRCTCLLGLKLLCTCALQGHVNICRWTWKVAANAHVN